VVVVRALAYSLLTAIAFPTTACLLHVCRHALVVRLADKHAWQLATDHSKAATCQRVLHAWTRFVTYALHDVSHVFISPPPHTTLCTKKRAIRDVTQHRTTHYPLGNTSLNTTQQSSAQPNLSSAQLSSAQFSSAQLSSAQRIVTQQHSTNTHHNITTQDYI